MNLSGLAITRNDRPNDITETELKAVMAIMDVMYIHTEGKVDHIESLEVFFGPEGKEYQLCADLCVYSEYGRRELDAPRPILRRSEYYYNIVLFDQEGIMYSLTSEQERYIESVLHEKIKVE